jgi:hypothetical protein
MVGSIIVGLLGKAIENILNGLGPFGEKLKEIASTVSSAFGSIGTVIAGIFGKIPSLIESAINIAIKGINALIDRFNDLPDWVRLGQRISNIDEFNFAGATQGAAPTEGQKPLQQMNANAFMAKTRYVKPEEQGEELLPEDTGGAGEKQKSWLEQLIETTNANYDLFVGGMSKAKNSMMDKLRKAIPNLPEQLVEAIGEGPEALNNIKALLSMNTKKRNNLIRKMIQTSTSKTVQDALDAAAKARRQKMVAGEAEAVLLSRGFSPEAAKEIAGNADFAFSIVQARAGKTKESLDQVIDAARGISEEMNNMATASDQLGWLNELMEMQQIQHDQEMKSIDDQIEAYKDQIAVIQEEIDAIEKLNDQDKDRISNLERQKEMISRQIEQLERANELDQRKIESLKREDELRNRVAEALGQELDQMSKQEDAIRKAYDERIKALDTVAKINDHIIQQQRSQISLSQALSQGDIYAAAQAQQEMQAQQIQFATEQQRTGLQQGMENQIAGLRTEGGLTREQAEQQIAAIKEQSYQTSLAIRDIEDQIYQRNQEMIPLKDQQYNLDRQIRDIQDTIYNREKQIKDIQDQRIAPLQTALDKQQKIKEQKEDEFAAQVESQKALIDQARLTDLQLSNTAKLGKNWRKVAEQIVAANNAMKNDLLELGPAPEWDQTSGETYAEFQARLDAYNAARNEIIGKRNTTVNTEMKNAPSTATTMNTGGLVSGNGSRDSIAARLTPGEFVMRKAAVNKYGKPLFQKMNMGSIDMPRYRTQAGTAFGSVSSANDAARNAAVYNTYSINVPVNQPGASADEIANKVMMKIKNIDNSSIRRINGY